MKRRNFMASASLAMATTWTALAPGLARAQGPETEAPVVAAPKIIEALTKDIVLDRPGVGGRPTPGPVGPSISLQVQFTFDSSELMPQGKRQLDQLAMALGHRELMHAGFLLAGHTDRVGDADYNVRLSMARANAVKVYLAEAHGISGARLQTIGYGFSQLLDPSNPAAAINRRVEVRRLIDPSGRRPAPDMVPNGRLIPTPN